MALFQMREGPIAALAHASTVHHRARERSDEFWGMVAALHEGVIIASLVMIGDIPNEQVESDIARIRRTADLADESGNPTAIATASMALGIALRKTQPSEALQLLERAVEISTSLGEEPEASGARFDLAAHYTMIGRPTDAIALMGPVVQRHLQAGSLGEVMSGLAPLAPALAELGYPELALTILGKLRADPHNSEYWEAFSARPILEAKLLDSLGSSRVDRLVEAGGQLSIAELAAQVLEAIEEVLA